jgi:hypothetical protein
MQQQRSMEQRHLEQELLLLLLIFFTMGFPTTLLFGSIAYLVLGVVALGTVFTMSSIGKLSKDDAA